MARLSRRAGAPATAARDPRPRRHGSRADGARIGTIRALQRPIAVGTLAAMPAPVPVDEIDLALLELLRADARRPVAELARAVNLSPAPVSRRIARLERHGVIAGYTTLVDEAKLGRGVEAFAEVRVRGDLDVAAVLELAASMPEAQEAFTVAGDPDALIRLVVDDAEQLRKAINVLRHSDGVLSTRTLLVIGSWRRAATAQAPPAQTIPEPRTTS